MTGVRALNRCVVGFTVGCIVVGAGSGISEAQPVPANVVPTELRLTEVSPIQQGDDPPWVERVNPSASGLEINGYRLVIGDSLEYVFPDAPLIVPANRFVVVVLDGLGEPANVVDPPEGLFE